MKNLFIFLSLILSISVSASSIEYSFQDSIQEGKIEAAYLNMLSADLKVAKKAFEAKSSNMPEPYDLVEGKIQAAILNMIEAEFDKADALYRALGNADSIDDASTSALRKKTALIVRLIEEI